MAVPGGCSKSPATATDVPEGSTGGVGGAYPAGTGNTAGALGMTGGAGGTRAFPSQACLDKASTLVGMMTVRRRSDSCSRSNASTPPPPTSPSTASAPIYSQGGSVPTPNTPTGWADMIDGYRQASYASRLKIPVIYGLDVVHGAGPVYGATIFPHNIGLGATRDPALVEQVAAAVAEEAAGVGRRLPVRARDRGGARRALGTHLRVVRRDA